jgi:RNA polymerase sigma-70 factor (ECF subfamily)
LRKGEQLLVERDNEQWLSDLSEPGSRRDAALADLRARLVRGLTFALAKYSSVSKADIEDFAQEALLKVLAGLDSFRGESRLTTWAQKIAVHVALTELRRRRWRDVSLDEIAGFPETDFAPRLLVDPVAQTEKQAVRNEILDILRQTIESDLTDKQRQALVAVRLRGVPMETVAQQMGTNRNALYKLLFDARKRLRERIVARGLLPQDALTAFGL